MSHLIGEIFILKYCIFPHVPADSAVISFTLQLEGNKCLTWFCYPSKSTKFEQVYITTH